jgi:hypothetical protein
MHRQVDSNRRTCAVRSDGRYLCSAGSRWSCAATGRALARRTAPAPAATSHLGPRSRRTPAQHPTHQHDLEGGDWETERACAEQRPSTHNVRWTGEAVASESLQAIGTGEHDGSVGRALTGSWLYARDDSAASSGTCTRHGEPLNSSPRYSCSAPKRRQWVAPKQGSA